MQLNKKRLVIILISFLSIIHTILIQINVYHYLRIASTQQYIQIIPRFAKGGSQHAVVQLRSSDSIYGRDWWEKPVVVEEYNLIFFTIPKVASTEFKLLFHRMMGLPYDLPANGQVHTIQNPNENMLKTLDDYPLWKAQEMMNSPEWTKAVFLREPKERVLSAFLNKFVKDKSYFRNKCCNQNTLVEKHDRDKCKKMINRKNFGYFLNRTQDCSDPHWDPQVYAIDDKWWSKINFIGYMASVQEDTENLLRSLTSIKDKRTAWDKVGKDGWGSSDGTEGGFMQTNEARHAEHARDKMLLQYTPRTEQFVEKHWKVEWQHETFHFEEFHLFNETRGRGRG